MEVYIVIGLTIIVAVASFVGVIVNIVSWQKKANKTSDDFYESPEEKVVFATVLEKEARNFHCGVKIPEYHIQYLVKFRTDDGKEIVYEVHEEIFNRINEGDTGNLVTLGGNFFDFGIGENID